ncbi:hypothetical protein GCM10022286_31240 [Gryllotalpicola daejeonensis]|uniref:Uncharacterized protein n=1 Tax=Gryllotalpicola daejeonensis TaxID=993087 RepID=A0ABP7ZP30_9MICO
MTGITVGVASTSRPAPAHARSPRPRRRRANPLTVWHVVAGVAHLARPVLELVWGAASLLFMGFATTVVVMFAAVSGAAGAAATGASAAARSGAGATGAVSTDPVSAVDGALAAVAADTAWVGPAFAAVPVLIALVHLAAIVLATSVLVRRRIGLGSRVASGVVLIVIAAAAVRFWQTVVTGTAPGPDVVAWVTLFLIPTIAVLIVELATTTQHSRKHHV